MPKKGTVLNFKNDYRKMRVPFVIYADFECFTVPFKDCSKKESSTIKYQNHKPSGFAFLIKCFNDEVLSPVFVSYTAKSEKDDVVGKFVQSLEENIKKFISSLNLVKK